MNVACGSDKSSQATGSLFQFCWRNITMPGTWTTFNAPNTSTGEFNADLMILLTDGSVLVRDSLG